jgi:hypothetical protein
MPGISERTYVASSTDNATVLASIRVNGDKNGDTIRARDYRSAVVEDPIHAQKEQVGQQRSIIEFL